MLSIKCPTNTKHLDYPIFRKMRQRWQTSLVLIALIASQNLCSFARQIPPQKHSRLISRQQHEEDQPVATQKVMQHNGDGHLMNTAYLIISLIFYS